MDWGEGGGSSGVSATKLQWAMNASGIRLIWELGNAIFTPFLCVELIKNTRNISGFYRLFPLTHTSFYILIPFWIMSLFTQFWKSRDKDFTLFWKKSKNQTPSGTGGREATVFGERKCYTLYAIFQIQSIPLSKQTLLFPVKKSQT